MIELVLAEDDSKAIHDELIGGEEEGCAILFASQTRRADGVDRLLIREVQFPAKSDYTKRGRFEAELTPEFVARMTKRARREDMALVFVHSHPGDDAPHFSTIDATGEIKLAAFLAHRHSTVIHAAVVVRRVRLYAKQMERIQGQYATCLALALLEKASKDPNVSEPEACFRAVAYLLASRILTMTFGAQSVAVHLAVQSKKPLNR